MSVQPIPRREPEVVKAEASRRYFGDDEKVPTTSLTELVVEGVYLGSRYGKAHELELMASVVRALPVEYVGLIHSIWCDSKACACYSVCLNGCTPEQSTMLEEQLDYWFCHFSSGHNGISIDGPAGTGRYIDCHWPGDDELFG